MSKLQKPFKFEWKGVPKIIDKHLMPLCVFSTGTIRGAYDSNDVVEVAESICKFLNAKEENKNSAELLCQLRDRDYVNNQELQFRYPKLIGIIKRLIAQIPCPNGEHNK